MMDQMVHRGSPVDHPAWLSHEGLISHLQGPWYEQRLLRSLAQGHARLRGFPVEEFEQAFTCRWRVVAPGLARWWLDVQFRPGQCARRPARHARDEKGEVADLHGSRVRLPLRILQWNALEDAPCRRHFGVELR